MTTVDRQAQAARLLMETLAALGVRDLVVSPGSRSTPLVIAADGVLRRHVIVDERSAGFFALGRARADGQAVALLCTSGSAPAHWLPAVLEAEASYVPLVLISADRPPEHVGCHANQATDQTRLFGAHVRAADDVDPAGLDAASAPAFRRRLAQTITRAMTPTPGPVHLNWRARKPLEPQASEHPDDVALAARLAALPRPPRLHHAAGVDEAALAALVAVVAGHARGLFVCGPSLGAPPPRGTRARLLALAERAGWPVWAEAASGLRFGAPHAHAVDGAEHLFRLPALPPALTPEVVVQLGAPPTSSAWLAHVDAGRLCPRLVLTPHGWPDPSGAADVVRADLDALLAAALARTPPRHAAWARAFAEAGAQAWAAVEETLAATPAPSEAWVARAVAESLPDGATLVVGNSLCVRNVDAFARGAGRELAVVHQRGLAGIDGQLAAAAGVASHGGEVVLLLGDVSLAHDVGSLALVARAPNLRVVVIDNGGGRIFEQLPLTARAELAHLAPAFLTPPALALAPLARAFGLGHTQVGELGALRAALAAPAPRLIEITVAPHNVADVDAAVRARVVARLAPPHRS